MSPLLPQGLVRDTSYNGSFLDLLMTGPTPGQKISSFRMCRVVVLFAQKPFKVIQRGLREDNVLYYLRVVIRF